MENVCISCGQSVMQKASSIQRAHATCWSDCNVNRYLATVAARQWPCPIAKPLSSHCATCCLCCLLHTPTAMWSHAVCHMQASYKGLQLTGMDSSHAAHRPALPAAARADHYPRTLCSGGYTGAQSGRWQQPKQCPSASSVSTNSTRSAA